MKASVIKPGYLVSLKTSINGGVNYRRVDIETEHRDETGALVSRWETAREIPDPAEFERATVARGAARSAVTRVCCASAFGLLAPLDQEGALFDAIAEAREIADRHNATASRTHIDVFVLVGQVAQNDVEAARAISYEIRELLDAMRAGIANADPEAIRESANKAKALGAMLAPEVSWQVSAAIKEARTAARDIVRRVEKAGETAASVVADCSTKAIEGARFSFLDLDEDESEIETEAPAGRGIDIPEFNAPESAPALSMSAIPFEL